MQNKRDRIRGVLAALDKVRSLDNDKIESLYLDLLVPFEIAELLDAGDKLKRDYFDVLNEAVTYLDLRDTESERFIVSANTCRAFLKQKIYNPETRGFGGETGRGQATVIGHMVSDKEDGESGFGSQIRLMDKYPWYKFMAGHPGLYLKTKEEEPGVYERIKARSKESRWETEGSMWLAADCNLCSGETIIRSLMQGKLFFRNEFGLNDNDVLWSPEVCGCTPSLPQILKKTRTKYFLTTGSKGEKENLPDSTFLWRGIDGSGILTHVIPEETLAETSPVKVIMTNDRALTGITRDNAFAFIGGEFGPDSMSLGILERLMQGLPGMPKIKVAEVREYFRQLDRRNKEKVVKVWCGELPLKRYRGTYSDNAEAKRLLRRAEGALLSAELFSSIALLDINAEYPKEEIKNGFLQVTEGSYEGCKETMERMQAHTDNVLNVLTEGLSKGRIRPAEPEEDCGIAVVREQNYIYVYNSTSFERDDVIEIPGMVRVFDEQGTELMVQYLEGDKTLCYVHGIPSKGYKSFRTEPGIGDLFEPASLRDEEGTFKLHTPLYFVTFNSNFEISSIYDKLAKREILKGKEGNVLRAYEDRNADGYKADIDAFYSEKSWRLNNVRSAKLVENGPVRYTLEIVRDFNKSTVTQLISFYAETKRIDFRTKINWKEKQLLLKAFFPLDVITDKAVYDVQFGNIERYTHENTAGDRGNYEVFAHKWVDVSEYGYGCALLNDGRYGCSVRGTTCTITLYNSLDEKEQQEECEFTYSLLPHEGDFRTGGVVKQGYFLNNPLLIKYGTEPKKTMNSWLGGLPENIVLETVKLPYASEGVVLSENLETGEQKKTVSLILRMYECFGSRTEALLKCSYEVSDAFECDMLEYSQKRAERTEEGVSLSFKPYEIKTIKLILGD